MRFELKHLVRYSRSIALPLALMAAFASVSACTSAGSSSSAPEAAAAAPAARSLEITISAAPDLNPGLSGNPAPLPIQIYVLKSTGKFQSLDYFALKNGGAGALGGDAVDTSSVTVRPGESKTVTISSGLDGAYIGVAAGYREIDNAKWQAQTGIGSANKFAISAGKSSVSISQR
jgi:type VI secretion system protein VasD